MLKTSHYLEIQELEVYIFFQVAHTHIKPSVWYHHSPTQVHELARSGSCTFVNKYKTHLC